MAKSIVVDIAEGRPFKFLISVTLIIIGLFLIGRMATWTPTTTDREGNVIEGKRDPLMQEFGATVLSVGKGLGSTVRGTLLNLRQNSASLFPVVIGMLIAASVMKALPDGTYETFFLCLIIFAFLVTFSGYKG